MAQIDHALAHGRWRAEWIRIMPDLLPYVEAIEEKAKSFYEELALKDPKVQWLCSYCDLEEPETVASVKKHIQDV